MQGKNISWKCFLKQGRVIWIVRIYSVLDMHLKLNSIWRLSSSKTEITNSISQRADLFMHSFLYHSLFSCARGIQRNLERAIRTQQEKQRAFFVWRKFRGVTQACDLELKGHLQVHHWTAATQTEQHKRRQGSMQCTSLVVLKPELFL